MSNKTEQKYSEDLEKAADTYAEHHGFRVPYDGSNNFYDDVDVKASKKAFKAGAEWQKEQMKKEALDAEVYKYVDTYKQNWTSFLVDVPAENFGHSAKIIVINED